MTTSRIAGRVIKSASIVHDYVQLNFDDGSILNVFNQIRTPTINDGFVAWLANKRVLEDITNKDVIILRLSGGDSVEIGMSDADYRGPEALELIEADGKRIVWS